jgi:hypothetical protein
VRPLSVFISSNLENLGDVARVDVVSRRGAGVTSEDSKVLAGNSKDRTAVIGVSTCVSFIITFRNRCRLTGRKSVPCFQPSLTERRSI